MNYLRNLLGSNNEYCVKWKIQDTKKQMEWCCAIAFDKNSQIMVSACYQDVIVWQFSEGKMQEYQRLKGHGEMILCFLFSKNNNWFISGSFDQSLICWKENAQNLWQSSKPFKQHNERVYCIIMNKDENEVISCSFDKQIIIWKASYNQNNLGFKYKLEEKHKEGINCISLNESETALVSCSFDKSIIVWIKGENQKWVYQNQIYQDDSVSRISFLNEIQIAAQQRSQGFTFIYEFESGNLDLKHTIQLKKAGQEGDCLFPSAFNKERQIFVQKHNKYVYLIKRQQNGTYSLVAKPIDCYSELNYGCISTDGNYVVVWIYQKFEYVVYKIDYQQ